MRREVGRLKTAELGGLQLQFAGLVLRATQEKGTDTSDRDAQLDILRFRTARGINRDTKQKILA